MTLHLLSEFIDQFATIDSLTDSSTATYWYEGRCPRSGKLLKLPRTRLAETIAQRLMQHLASDQRYSYEGKMYGVLLVKTPSGEQRVLKAFSGLLHGKSTVDGWVPAIPGRELVAIEEAYTLTRLDVIKQQLIALHSLPEREQYAALAQTFADRLHDQATHHHQRKTERQHQRQQLIKTLNGEALAIALEQLNEQSRRDGIERRHLKRERDQALQPLKQCIDQADAQMRDLKQQRKQLSQQLQAQMHNAYWLTNFAGDSLSLQQLMPNGSIPTGTGDCCAPKLLHYAATHGLEPLAMAEFWYGSTHSEKVQGAFYGVCEERCQPLMGFLLSGLSHAVSSNELNSTYSIPILYEDEWLIAVDKPTGLLSVPGRYHDRQDSMLNRLRHQFEDGRIIPIHRLDQDTSGILLFARDRLTHRYSSQQFQKRQVHKVYEAILAGSVALDQGVIDLPLWSDPNHRPYQIVDWQRGKPSITHFNVIAREGHYTRVELMPVTGRTHQLRVHAADANGLGMPILGDRLYGCNQITTRLHLHARELTFKHPFVGQLSLKTTTPF